MNQGVEALLASVELPPWDRTIDIVCHTNDYERRFAPNPANLFSQTLESYRLNTIQSGRARGSLSGDSNTRRLSYSDLPDHIRLRICHYLTADFTEAQRDRAVTLSLPVFLRPVWAPDTFTPIHVALAPYQPYLSVSSALRADMLIFFLSSHTFHVVFSPFVNTRLSPFATLWLSRYGVYMRSIVLEIDMTKLGNGPAARLLGSTKQFKKLVRMFAESQARHEKPLGELILLCRRFYGRRRDYIDDEAKMKQKSHLLDRSPSPDSHGAYDQCQNIVSQDDLGFYCPDYRLSICDPLLDLQGRVSSLRMCGFGDRYARRFVARMFPDPDHRFAYRLAPSAGPWGRVEGQKRFIDDGTGNIISDDGIAFCARFQHPVMPPPPITDPGTKVLSLPMMGPTRAPETPTQTAMMRISRETQMAGASAPTSAVDVSASEKKRRFLKLLAECLVNREKRRFFSR